MTYTGASLADGQVGGSAANVYAVPSGKTAVIKTFSVYNTNTTAETVKAYVLRKGGTARQIGIAVLAQNESKEFIDNAITLSSEDSLQAETTTASKVDYSITGATE